MSEREDALSDIIPQSNDISRQVCIRRVDMARLSLPRMPPLLG